MILCYGVLAACFDITHEVGLWRMEKASKFKLKETVSNGALLIEVAKQSHCARLGLSVAF